MPLGYRYMLQGGRVKDLEFPFSARFTPDDINPFSTSDTNILYTDESGEVSFPFLRFSIFGYSGSYSLQYYCEGANAPATGPITVTTSVT